MSCANVIERVVALSRGDQMMSDALSLGRPLSASSPAPQEMDAKPSAPPSSPNLRRGVQHFERAEVLVALQQSQGHQTRAAILLGISRRTLANEINSHRIERRHWARRAPDGLGDAGGQRGVQR